MVVLVAASGCADEPQPSDDTHQALDHRQRRRSRRARGNARVRPRRGATGQQRVLADLRSRCDGKVRLADDGSWPGKCYQLRCQLMPRRRRRSSSACACDALERLQIFDHRGRIARRDRRGTGGRRPRSPACVASCRYSPARAARPGASRRRPVRGRTARRDRRRSSSGAARARSRAPRGSATGRRDRTARAPTRS